MFLSSDEIMLLTFLLKHLYPQCTIHELKYEIESQTKFDVDKLMNSQSAWEQKNDVRLRQKLGAWDKIYSEQSSWIWTMVQ